MLHSAITSPTLYVSFFSNVVHAFDIPLVVTALSSVCTKSNLYDKFIPWALFGKSLDSKSFLYSIFITNGFTSFFDKISPIFNSVSSSLYFTVNVIYFCCSSVKFVFSMFSIFAFISPSFTKSTVYVTLSPGFDSVTFISFIDTSFSIFAVFASLASPTILGSDRF